MALINNFCLFLQFKLRRLKGLKGFNGFKAGAER